MSVLPIEVIASNTIRECVAHLSKCQPAVPFVSVFVPIQVIGQFWSSLDGLTTEYLLLFMSLCVSSTGIIGLMQLV